MVNKGYFNYFESTINKYTLQQIVKANPFNEPAWKQILASDDPEHLTTVNSVPPLMAQGGADEQIPVISTQLLATHLCGLGLDLSGRESRRRDQRVLRRHRPVRGRPKPRPLPAGRAPGAPDHHLPQRDVVALRAASGWSATLRGRDSNSQPSG